MFRRYASVRPAWKTVIIIFSDISRILRHLAEKISIRQSRIDLHNAMHHAFLLALHGASYNSAYLNLQWIDSYNNAEKQFHCIGKISCIEFFFFNCRQMQADGAKTHLWVDVIPLSTFCTLFTRRSNCGKVAVIKIGALCLELRRKHLLNFTHRLSIAVTARLQCRRCGTNRDIYPRQLDH